MILLSPLPLSSPPSFPISLPLLPPFHLLLSSLFYILLPHFHFLSVLSATDDTWGAEVCSEVGECLEQSPRPGIPPTGCGDINGGWSCGTGQHTAIIWRNNLGGGAPHRPCKTPLSFRPGKLSPSTLFLSLSLSLSVSHTHTHMHTWGNVRPR